MAHINRDREWAYCSAPGHAQLAAMLEIQRWKVRDLEERLEAERERLRLVEDVFRDWLEALPSKGLLVDRTGYFVGGTGNIERIDFGPDSPEDGDGSGEHPIDALAAEALDAHLEAATSDPAGDAEAAYRAALDAMDEDAERFEAEHPVPDRLPIDAATAPRRGQPIPLLVEIQGIDYEATEIDPGEDNTAAFRLVKRAGGGEVYDVCRTKAGVVECDCPHYEMRLKGNTISPCKHGKALIDAGLIGPPAVVAVA